MVLRTENLLRIDNLFDFLLRQSFEYMAFLPRGLKGVAHRLLLSRPAARHDSEICSNLLPHQPKPREKIQTRVGVVHNQKTWLNASHPICDQIEILVHDEAAFISLCRGEQQMRLARPRLADEHNVLCQACELGEVIASP